MARGLEIAVCAAGLALLVVAIHAPRERAEFSFDDRDYVVNNTAVRGPGVVQRAFLAPFPPHMPEKGLYRPLTQLSYARDYARAGLDARTYHRSNVRIYVWVVWAVYALALLHRPSGAFALAVAALFAAHPVHCEAVDSVTGRSELLAALFSLFSILGFSVAARRWAEPGMDWIAGIAWAGSALAYALAMASKETGAVVPAVLVLYFLCFGRRREEAAAQWLRRAAWLLSPFALILIVYLLARARALGALAIDQEVSGSLAFRVHSLGMAALQYARLLFLPATLHVDYYWDQFFADPRRTLGWSLLGCTIVGLSLRSLLHGGLRRLRFEAPSTLHDAMLCGLGILVCFLLPVSHLLPIGALMAERFLFSPSVGFCLWLVAGVTLVMRWAVASSRSRVAVGTALLAIAVLGGALRSHARALEWRDELRLWQVEDSARPGDGRILTNLGLAYAARGRMHEARAAFARARRAEPRSERLDRVLDQIESRL